MARQTPNELRVVCALYERGLRATKDELAAVLDRRSYLDAVLSRLGGQLLQVIVEDRQRGVVILNRTRARLWLGLRDRPAGIQGEIFSDDCLLPVVGELGEQVGAEGVKGVNNQPTGPPARAPVVRACTAPQDFGRHPYTSYELTRVQNSSSSCEDPGTRIGRRENARREEAYTTAARSIAASYRKDDYLFSKLDRAPQLRAELFKGQTPTSRRFALLWLENSARAHELIAEAIEATHPGRKLNWLLANEGVRYQLGQDNSLKRKGRDYGRTNKSR